MGIQYVEKTWFARQPAGEGWPATADAAASAEGWYYAGAAVILVAALALTAAPVLVAALAVLGVLR